MINNLIQRRKKNKLNHDNSKSNCFPKLNRSFTKINTSNINNKFNYSEIIDKKELIPNNKNNFNLKSSSLFKINDSKNDFEFKRIEISKNNNNNKQFNSLYRSCTNVSSNFFVSNDKLVSKETDLFGKSKLLFKLNNYNRRQNYY